MIICMFNEVFTKNKPRVAYRDIISWANSLPYNTLIKKKNVLNLPNTDAGKPSFVEFLRLEIINSLNKINDKDQKGIELFLQRKIRGIK